MADNMREDTLRILLEQRKLEAEIEMLQTCNKKLQSEIALNELKKTYVLLKIQHEYGYGIVQPSES